MKPVLTKSLFAAAGLAIVAGLTVPAAARHFSGFHGIAQNPAQATCFANGWGAIQNQCAATRTYCMPLVIDDGVFGTYADAAVTVLQPGSATLSCQTTTTTRDGSPYSWSGNINASRTGAYVDVVVHGGPIPSGGGAYTCCDLPPGGQIATLNY